VGLGISKIIIKSLKNEQSFNLLLAFASTVIMGLGPRRDTWKYFLFFPRHLCILKWGPHFEERTITSNRMIICSWVSPAFCLFKDRMPSMWHTKIEFLSHREHITSPLQRSENPRMEVVAVFLKRTKRTNTHILWTEYGVLVYYSRWCIF
jgi:hypothetical protein